jgi:dihydrofolate synthase/folylpolyglutamate synthase
MNPSSQTELQRVEEVLESRWPETIIEPSLDRISQLVSLLGDPHLAYPVIHVTGTNGKT